MTSMLWQTCFVVHGLSPLSLDHGFRHLRLLTLLQDHDHQLTTSCFSSHDCFLHTLCLSLLRAASAVGRTSPTRSPFCVAFPDSHTAISVVFPVMKKSEMERTLQHVLTSFREIRVDCTADEEFGSGLAMENTLLFGLTAALVRDGWTVFEGNLAVHGVITEWLAGTPTEAVAFAVHTEPNDCIDFLLSPDVIWFRPFQIGRFLIGSLKKQFDDGAVVILDNFLENMSPDDIEEMKCLVLPSMKEGLVSGCCKSLPKDFSLSKHREIWTEKHGLVLPEEDFYIRVSFPLQGNKMGLWFPSCLVLRRCGVIPALPNIRAAKIHSILQRFMSSISRWDFFNSGELKLKCNLWAAKESQNVCWTTANLTMQTSQIKLIDCNFDPEMGPEVSSIEAEALQNFRRPRLPPSHYAVSKNTEPFIPDMHGVDDLIIAGHSVGSTKPVVARFPTSLKIPVFPKRKIRDVQTSRAGMIKCEIKSQKHIPKICMELGKSSKKPQEGDSKSIAGVSLPKKKRICAEPEKSSLKMHQESKSKSVVGELPETTSLLKKKKTPVSSQPSIQKLQMLPTASIGAPNAMMEPSSCVKQPSQVATGYIKDQATSKLKNHSAQKVATSTEKKSARGEKKSANTPIDSETNKEKVLSKHAQGKLSDLTVPELKLFLSENKTKVSGKKEELVQRVVLLLSSSKKA